MGFFGYKFIKNVSTDSAERSFKKSILSMLKRTQPQQNKNDLKKLLDAIKRAKNPDNPNRDKLYEIYDQAMMDGQGYSLVDQRKKKLLAKEFVIYDASGKRDEEKTKIINSEWFYDFANYSIEAILYGHSLIQFDGIQDGNFTGCRLIPRPHVKPELGIFVESPTDKDGTSYMEGDFLDWVVPVGNPDILGALLVVSVYAIRKNFSLNGWSMYQELFGMPLRIGKTSALDSDSIKNFDKQLELMGTNSRAVIGIDDKIEFLQANGSIGNPVYENMARYCDEQISKILMGQTTTADALGGQYKADSHQAVADEYGKSDARYLAFVVNGKLIPMMNRLGFNWDGCAFGYSNDNEEYEETRRENEKMKSTAEWVKLMKEAGWDIPQDELARRTGINFVPSGAGQLTNKRSMRDIINKRYYGD